MVKSTGTKCFRDKKFRDQIRNIFRTGAGGTIPAPASRTESGKQNYNNITQ
jgi:hypothetical protein